jgi:hypothetical protein
MYIASSFSRLSLGQGERGHCRLVSQINSVTRGGTDLVDLLLNLLEACSDDQIFDQWSNVHDSTGSGGCTVELVLPSVEGTVCWKSVVVGRSPCLEVHNFQPATRLEISHALVKQSWPVRDRASHVCDPDVVKLVVKVPISLAIVDLYPISACASHRSGFQNT